MTEPVRLRPKRPCPICGKPSQQKYHPFCSSRCAQVDLNRWLGDVVPSPLSATWILPAIGNIVTWEFVGYNMLIFSAALEQLPDSVLEAAAIDGATGWRTIWSIVLPMISPSIFFATIMTMITSLQVFAQPQLLTGGGPGNATLPLVMWIYNQGFKFQDLGLAAAGAWILFALIIAITALQFSAQKRWVHYEH